MPTNSLIKRIFTNPALGLIPMLVFSLMIGRVDSVYVFFIGFGLSVLPFIMRVRRELRILFDISAYSFLLASLGLVFSSPNAEPQKLFILTELIFLSILMVFRFMRGKIAQKIGGERLGEKRFYFQETLQVAMRLQYILILHLMLVLSLYVFYPLKYPMIKTVVVINLFQVIVVVLIFLEAIRLKLLNNCLLGEEWLPVINECGAVQGKIAKSVSISMKNKLMHPIVRIALIYDGMLYLKERDSSRLLNPGRLDYPFEAYMQYKHDIGEALKDAVRGEIKTETLPVKFLLKYVFKNETTKRLVFLYVSIIESEEEFNKLDLKAGKLWTLNQIQDNINCGVFSETFEQEFYYLKNTVLMTGVAVNGCCE